MTSRNPSFGRSFARRLAAARRHRKPWAGTLAGALTLGCNAVLGIEEATLCGGVPCDDGAASIESVQPTSPPAAGGATTGSGASDAGTPSPPANGELGVPAELDPAGSAPPNADNDDSGNGNSGSGNPGSGNPGSGNPGSGNPGNGNGNSGNGNGNSGAGNGNSGPSDGMPPAQDPASPCVGRNGETFCMGSTRVSCGPDGNPSIIFPCPSEAHCTQGTAASCAACLAGEALCEGAVLRVCNAARDGFEDQPCASASQCDPAAGRCVPPTCAPNEARCEGSVLLTCNSTLTGFDSLECGSPPGCNPTLARCNFCAPNAARCADDGTVAVCDSSGQSEVLISCGVAEFCSGGTCRLIGLLP
jgi:hypothetical protein